MWLYQHFLYKNHLLNIFIWLHISNVLPLRFFSKHKREYKNYRPLKLYKALFQREGLINASQFSSGALISCWNSTATKDTQKQQNNHHAIKVNRMGLFFRLFEQAVSAWRKVYSIMLVYIILLHRPLTLLVLSLHAGD